MNILFVTPILPHARDTGSSLFSQSLIDLLREGGATVRPIGWQGLGASDELVEGAVGRRAFITRQHRAAALAWAARALLLGEPFSIAKFRSRRFDRAVRRGREWADVAILDHEMAWALPLLGRDVKIVHVSHQIASKIYLPRSLNPIFRRETRRLRRIEAELASRAHQIWTISPDDAEDYRKMGAADVRYLPYTPDVSPAAGLPAAPRYDCVLLGTWTWAPNRAGLEWFLAKVGPRLGRLSIAIAGRGSQDFEGRWSNVVALGEVPDALAFLRSGRVVLIPSTQGVGLQTKLLTALASGRPIVATSLAARHVDARPRHLLLAGEPAAFADAVGAAMAMVPGAEDALAGRRGLYRQEVMGALNDLAGSVRAGLRQSLGDGPGSAVLRLGDKPLNSRPD